MRTNTRVQFSLFDVTAREDSAPASAAAQPFCGISADLKRDAVPTQAKYGTLENRQFRMDGSFALFPDEPAGGFWGLWSRQLSGADGRFADPPVLEITFTQPHSSAGLTLHFYEPTGDWASDVTIQWYSAAGTLLKTARFYPDAADYYCPCKVESYARLALTFAATSRPGRYLKLAGLDYGVLLLFSGEEVVSARLLEEVDPLSGTLSVNTLTLTLFNKDRAFSLLNPDGVFDVLQNRQRFTVYEDVREGDGVVTHNMGTFYLSAWENTSDTLADFTATDAVGLLDAVPHNGGMYDTTAAALAAELLEGFAYALDDALAAEPVRGYLPAGSRRAALQQLAFALGAVVDCSRSDKINIYPPPTRPSSLITRRRKWQGGKAALRPLVTGVAVTAHRYAPAAEAAELFRQELPAGVHRIALPEPATELAVTGGVLLESGVNHAVVQLQSAGVLVLTGYKYADAQTVTRRTAADLPAGTLDNVLEVKDATLVSPDRAGAAADRILTYYAGRCELRFSMQAGGETLADMLIVESLGGERVRGVLEQLELDLTGGFVADALVVGKRLAATAPAYAGEIFAGERSVI